MKLLLLTCSMSVSVDQRKNAVSIFEILENISSTAFPIAIPQICITAILTRDDSESGGEKRLTLRVTLDDTVLLEGPYMASFEQRAYARAFGELGALVIERPGKLVFSLLDKKKVLGTWPILVLDIGASLTQAVSPAATKSAAKKSKRKKIKKSKKGRA